MLLRVYPCNDLKQGIAIAEELSRTIPNSHVLVGTEGEQAPEFDLVGAGDLLATEAPPLAWHVPGIIPAGLPTLLFGDGGTGKSLAALQLAVATVTARSWLDQPIAQSGPVIFMTAEDDEGEVHRRLEDICRTEGIATSDLANLKINAKVGEDALLGIFNPDTRMIEPTGLFGALERTIERTSPSLVVLDTLADLFGGDENVRSQARQFVGLLRRLSLAHGSTVLCLAHPSAAGISSGTGTSGSTAWSNSVRSRLYLERVFEWRGRGDNRRFVEPDPDARVLTTKKINYGQTGNAMRLRWRDGVLVPDVILADMAPASSKAAETAAEANQRVDDKFLEILAAYQAEGRNVADAGPTYAPTKFAKDERAEGITNKSFAKAMQRLFAQERIRTVVYGRGYKRIEVVS
ncbi:AAA family ATPase [Antarcticirhabdus aurantiaca]|uniref:AAA family ATPase n=1 Tax=Antarcticirhabdus aurantiaca TaxID=2606717 RepID=A0ACD4NV09_9HYPH|nr:AAA family ATPase [Antarcticirhabdus aurantiaca]WAJ30609.1 AAA family ATPase [Jeongeuplla avenae]